MFTFSRRTRRNLQCLYHPLTNRMLLPAPLNKHSTGRTTPQHTKGLRTSRSTTRHDTIRHDTTRHNTTRHDTTRHDTTRHDTTPHWPKHIDTARYEMTRQASTRHYTVRHGTTVQSTTRHDTTRHDTAYSLNVLINCSSMRYVRSRTIPSKASAIWASTGLWLMASILLISREVFK